MLRRNAGIAIVLGTFLWSCSNEAAPDESVAEPPQVSSPSATTLVALDKADAADGSSDKVVAKCLSCNLSMAGKAEHASTYGEYEVHLCSTHCKAYFEKNQEKVLASLK
jgi:YHS domain-containing protein